MFISVVKCIGSSYCYFFFNFISTYKILSKLFEPGIKLRESRSVCSWRHFLRNRRLQLESLQEQERISASSLLQIGFMVHSASYQTRIGNSLLEYKAAGVWNWQVASLVPRLRQGLYFYTTPRLHGVTNRHEGHFISHPMYRGADKSLARLGRKQAAKL